ncbi:hypothetical protein E2C01_046784 [Portunus trituberculatus]|uniref:Uncharacterized protein n=1 Tax=Portunus trituberculatus TaxID=210409 RepID=A0A5B7G8P8_PORTR|nr:hypothetical protein [Portunus trituberculatus]
MGRVSKSNKQRKDAGMVYGSSKNKKSVETDTSYAPVHILASPTTTTLTTTTPLPATPTPQPTTFHAEQRKGNEEEQASLLTIREALLQDIERNEDEDGDVELVMLTKRRLKNLLPSCCSCPYPAFANSFEPDVYENTITMHCTTCNFKNTSQPEKVRAGHQKKFIFKTNISLTKGD